MGERREMHDILVRDVMSTSVHIAVPEMDLVSASQRMLKEAVSCLIVEPANPSDGYGILTQKDVLSVITEQGPVARTVAVEEVMTQPVLSVSPSYNLETCIRLMQMLGVRRTIVVHDTQLLGLVTFTDLFKAAVESLEG